jgi:hypothetical protein
MKLFNNVILNNEMFEKYKFCQNCNILHENVKLYFE